MPRFLAIAFAFLGFCAPAQAGDFKWDVPEVVSTIGVPSTQDVDGIPTRFNVYRSKLSIQDLVFHFARSFHAAGLFVDSPRPNLQMRDGVQLTGLDGQALVSYTVILRRGAGEHTTSVITGEAHLSEWVAQHGKVSRGADFAPLYPNAESVVRTRAETLNLITYSAVAKKEQVEAFYADALGRQGYKAVEAGVFQKKGQRISVQVRPDAASPQRVSIALRATSVPAD